MHLLYLSDISQLDYVRKKKPDLLLRTVVLTADMVVAAELERSDIEFIDEWNYLSPLEIEQNWKEAYRLSGCWWDETVVSTDCLGVRLSEAARQDWVYALEASLNARNIYRKIIADLRVSKISGFFLPAVGVVRTGPVPTRRAVCSVTQAILLYVAEANSIPISRLTSEFPLVNATMTAPWWRPIKNLWDEKTADVDSKLRTTLPVDQLILVYEAAMPAAELKAVRDAVGQMSGVRMISISQSGLELLMANQNRDAVAFDIAGPMRSHLQMRMDQYDGEFPEFFANPHLSFQFDRLIEEMQRAATLGQCFDCALEILQPSLILFAHEAFTVERVLVAKANARGIPTAALIHGGIRFKFGAKGVVGDARHILAWSSSDVEWFKDYGIDSKRLVQTGCVRYERAYQRYLHTDKSVSLMGRKVAKRALSLNSEQAVVVLVTAEVNTGLAAPVAHAGQHRAAIRDYMDYIARRPEIQFIIKAHPTYDYYEWYRRLTLNGPPNVRFLEQAILGDVMRASDVCIMINYCTTASLDAMFNHVPVIYCENAVYPLSDWHDNLKGTDLHRVGSIKAMGDAIDQILSSESTRCTMLDANNDHVAAILGASEGSATERLSHFLKNIIRIQSNERAPSFYSILQATGNLPKYLDEWMHSKRERMPLCNIDFVGNIIAYDIGYSGYSRLPLEFLRKYSARGIRANSESFNGKCHKWIAAFSYGITKGKVHDGSLIAAMLAVRHYLIYSICLMRGPVELRRQISRYLMGALFKSVYYIFGNLTRPLRRLILILKSISDRHF